MTDYFAERLRVVLAKRDWSGAKLAREIGKTRAAVAPWLRGSHRPPPKTIMAICKVLDCDASWLLSPYPVDLHGPATDSMRDTLIGMFVAGVFSEGQTAKATGLDHVEVRRRAHKRVEDLSP